MNRTYKRLLVMVLVCTMILGVLPAITLPILAEEASGPVYQAAYAESVTVDGALDKTFLINYQMSEGAAFGAMWNRNTFYLAVAPRQGDSKLEITFGDQKLTVTKAGATGIDGAKSAWGKVIEVSIPNTVVSYDDTKALSLSMGNASWAGTVEYSSVDRVVNVTAMPMRDWNVYADNYFQGGYELENGIRYTSIYGETGDATTCYTLGYFDLLQTRKANISLEFNFYAEKMPVQRPAKPAKNRFTDGYIIGLTDGDINGVSSAIINTKDGLVFAILDKDNNYSYTEMGKSLKEQFQIRLEWTLEGHLNLYIDGVLIKVFENAQANKEALSDRGTRAARILALTVARSAVPTSSDQDIDVTATNVCLGNSYEENPLAGLDFSVISGKNNYASKVEYDLELPDTYAHVSGQFPAEEIVWHSAREDYITTEGKVTPNKTPLNVILTASLKRDPSVSTQILVKVVRKTGKFLVVSSDETPMKLDGTMNEGPEAWKTELPMAATEGASAPTGMLYGAWGQGNVYLAIQQSGANSLELKMNNKVLRLDLATGTFMGESYGAAAKISGGVVELQIPLKGIGMYAYQYEQVMRFEAKLVGEGGTAAVYDHQMDISLTSEVKYEQNLNDFNVTGSPVVSEDGSSATLTPAITPQAVFKNDLSVVDHSVDMTIVQTILATDIPEGPGGFKNVTDVSQGYNFWVIDGAKDETQSLLRAKIYNHAAKGLVLQILKNNSMEIAEVVLGKTSGSDAEAFQLKLVWGKDNSVKVYVDDAEKATIADVTLTYSEGEMGNDGFQLHCAEMGLKLTVSDFGMEVPPVAINLNDANTVTGDVTISEDGTSATLKPVLEISSVGKNDLPEVDHTRDMVITHTLKVGYLPVAEGGFASLLDMDGGYHFLVVDGETTAEQNVLRVKIYNDSERGLVLQVLKNNQLETADIALGKAVGDTFTMELEWKADDSLNVIVDDVLKGTVIGLALTYTGDELGSNGFLAGCETKGADINVSDLTFYLPVVAQDLANGNALESAEISEDGTTATFNPELAENGFWGKDLKDVDHSSAMTLTQTVLVSEMMVSSGGFESLTDMANAYHFWIADGEANAEQDVLRAKIYNNATNGLTLQVMKNASLETAEVVLGKAIGESFLLKLVWGTDGSLKVYVDDAEKATVTGIDLDYTGEELGSNSLRICAMSYGLNVTVSNFAIERETAVYDFSSDTLVTDAAVSDDGTTLTFSTAVGENYAQKNDLALVDHSKDMIINQTVKAEAMPAGTPGFKSVKDMAGGYHFWVIDGAADATQTVLHIKIYNDATNGLTLQILKNNSLETVDVVLGKAMGSTFKLTLTWQANNSVIVSVDDAVKATATDVNVTYTGGDMGNDGIRLSAQTSGVKVVVSNVTFASALAINLSAEAGNTVNGVTVSPDGNSATPVAGSASSTIYKDGLPEINGGTDMLLTQTIYVEDMPEGNRMRAGRYSFAGTGYFFWIVDGESGNNNTKYFTLANIYNHATKGLILQVQIGDTGNRFEEVELDKREGDTFTLGYQYHSNRTVEVYVDGVLKGSVEDAGYTRETDNTNGYDGYRICWANSDNKVTVSNVSLDKAPEESLTGATTVGAASVSGTTATLEGKVAVPWIRKVDLSEVDHTANMLFTQTLQVVSLPTGTKMPDGGSRNIAGTGYYFYIVDGPSSVDSPTGKTIKYFTLANMYNDAERGLVLQVQKGNGDKYDEVVLGKREGDTFTLGYLSYPNHTVEVFVDGVSVGTVASAGYYYEVNDGRGYDGFVLACGAADAKIITSNVSIVNTYSAQMQGTSTTQVIQKRGLAEINHSAEMTFTQKIHVVSMPVGYPMASGVKYNMSGTGYYFYIVDGPTGTNVKYFTLANMYNDAERGLVLQLQRNVGDEFAEVVLGKKVGDTFTLGYKSYPNHTVDVFVDDVLVDTVVSCGYYRNDGTARGYDGYLIGSNLAGTKVIVSDVSITSSYTTASKVDTLMIREEGLAEVDHTVNMLFNQTLKVNAMPVGQPMASGVRYNMAGTGYMFYLVDGPSGTNLKYFTLANMYNDAERGLVLQVQRGVGDQYTEVVLGKKVGDTFTLGYLSYLDNTVEVFVDGVSVGVAPGSGYYRNDSNARGYDGYLINSGSGGTDIEVSNVSITSTFSQGFKYSNKQGDVVVDKTKATFDMKASATGMYLDEILEIDHSRDLILSQEIRIDAMPVDQPMVSTGRHSVVGNGYIIMMTDGVRGENKSLFFANIYNSSKQGLVLQIEHTSGVLTDVVLGKKVGETFRLDLMWGADDSTTVYVDGKLKGTYLNTTYINAGDTRGRDRLGISANGMGEVKVHIKDVYLTPGTLFANVQEELTPEEVFKGFVDITNVDVDVMRFPEYYDSPYLGRVPLTWESSDPDVINVETGKVYHKNAKIGTYVTLTATIEDIRVRELFKVEAYATGTGTITIQSPKILYAAFTDNVVLDGKFTAETGGEVTDEGWQMATLLGETGTLGVQWDTKNLYIAVRDLDVATADALSITLKGNSISLENAVTVDGVTELAIPMRSLGINVNNYGAEIPAVVQLGEGKWTGTIVLSSTNWIVSDTTYPRFPNAFSASGPVAMAEDMFTEYQYMLQRSNGYDFYDLYNLHGFNPHSIMNNLYLMGVVSTQEPWEFTILKPIEDKAVATYAELDFQAMQMPEYKLGTSSVTHPYYATCGFNWNIGLEPLSGQYTKAYQLGIINTSDGLYFVARGNSGDRFVRLDRYLGDYFRLGVRMEVDGGLTLYVDGQEITYLKDIKKTARGTSASVSMNTLRNDERALSSNDSIEVHVSNLAIGKNYGDTLLDTLIFDNIRGKNGRDMGAVTRDLVLPETWNTVQLPEPQKITWTSSDPSVLNAETGDVTRPEGNGKYVVLTATIGDESKVFELFVKGLNPDGKIMAVKDDRDTAHGQGVPENEVHFYNLDQDNNSIIIDQGESKKVNVIQLIDSDAVSRLNESVLTIWYSDDNETYTEIDNYFKLLRDGVNTWLYGFEVEARYIKVHCTHYNPAESDMVNILKDMIKVDYVAIFGDGDAAFATTSAVGVKNDKDNTIFDQFFVITPEEAGVKCLKEDMSDVRFFLGDEILYHYYDGKNFVVRVTKVPANGEAILTVLSGNAEAMNIDNKEFVHEVVYGTREGQDEDIVALAVGMPDGKMMGLKGVGAAWSYWWSDDDGRTWKDKTDVANSQNFLHTVQAVYYDDHNGRIITQGRITTSGGFIKTRFMYSDDMGKTWKQCPEIDKQGIEELYWGTYAYFVETSCYDGEDGPNVDFVIPIMTGNVANKAGADQDNYVRCGYSTDAGLTWKLSTERIYFTDTEGRRRFLQENGLTECSILEDDNGRLVFMARCQYGDVNNFAVSYSYDWGMTWVDAKGNRGSAGLSTVYTTNTDPKLIEINKEDFLFWGGNLVLGATSFQRQPFNVAVSYDNMETFGHIQDMFSRYSMQGMTMSDRCYVMNPDIAYDKVDDNLFLVWQDDIGAPSLRIYHFSDFFYRTRGVYDSFENSTVKYEGWATTSGNISRSAEQATDSSYSMKLETNSSVVRSVPYLQKGKVSFDMYLENKDANEMQFELESAYGLIHGQAAPIAFTLREGKLFFLAADRKQAEVEIAANLQNGWNHFEFDLGLAEETPYGTLSVNGGEAVAVPMALEIGNYITFVHVTTIREACYIDNFLVVDDDNLIVPEEEIKGEVSELTEVPEVLKEQYTDVKSIEDAMMNALVEANKDGYTAQGSKAYNVDLMITRDNGKNWRAADTKDLLMDGVVVKLPYPSTTSRESHTFSAVLMPTENSAKMQMKLGEARILNVSAEADAIYVTMLGSGPVLLTWVQTGDAPIGNDGGDAWIFIVIGVLAILAAAAVVILVIRKKRASAPVLVADEAAVEETPAETEEAPAEENENEVNNEEET